MAHNKETSNLSRGGKEKMEAIRSLVTEGPSVPCRQKPSLPPGGWRRGPPLQRFSALIPQFSYTSRDCSSQCYSPWRCLISPRSIMKAKAWTQLRGFLEPYLRILLALGAAPTLASLKHPATQLPSGPRLLPPPPTVDSGGAQASAISSATGDRL